MFLMPEDKQKESLQKLVCSKLIDKNSIIKQFSDLKIRLQNIKE